MPRTIRYHLDESCQSSIARGLRVHGIDVTMTSEVGLLAASDEMQCDFARRERRVIVTHDTDFLAMGRTTAAHAGIVYCHQRRHSVGEIIKRLVLLWELCDDQELHDRIEYL